ncbi:MAG: hypothetical protein NUV64_03710 [Parcubacteria group bacterium]|nr:hypothetical protein [Parcubacteria group bacterium]MCR4342307.1 hypothetical protein [Patescibacteria group bacterium]
MKFEFRISKWANFYYFVQNLSEWHFSNRKDYNIFWREKLKSFSKDEESVLEKFKEIRFKYPKTKSCFERAFFLSESPFEELNKCLSEREYLTMKEIFNVLEDKFDALYKEDEVLLKKWKDALSEESNDKNLIIKILSILKILYKSNIDTQEVSVTLLFSTPEHIGGGANIDRNMISLEVSRYPIENINQAIGIIWHEIIHLMFQERYFSLLLDYFKEDEQVADLVNELTAGSLFPNGILGIRILKNKPSTQLLPQVTKGQTIMIINLAKEYVEKGSQLDRNFINRLIDIIKEKN